MEIPDTFSLLLKNYKSLKERLGIYYLCHGPREGDPNDRMSLEKEIGYNRTMTIELKPHEIEKCLDSVKSLSL